MPGTPCDGHTLYSQLERAEFLTGVQASLALADRGDKGPKRRPEPRCGAAARDDCRRD